MEPLLPIIPFPDLPPELHGRCIKVVPGIHADYVLAGPAVPATVHHVVGIKRTLPCFKAMTNAKLSCPYCGFKARYACYVPLLFVGGKEVKRHVVQGAKRTMQTTLALKPGDVVSVLKGKGDRDTPLLQPSQYVKQGVNLEAVRRKCPQDIGPYLLHLWQQRALTEFFGQTFYPSARSLEHEPGGTEGAESSQEESAGQ